MSKEEQSQGFNLHSQNQLHSLDSSRQSLSAYTANVETTQPSSSTNRVKHVYLEQQNTYGRFVPYLLLKDQLESQLDNSGHTALHHMCSHNSQYLPLYLSTLENNDPILNLKSKLGHSPLDVAGIYCRKDYVDLLLEKGATDNGNIDHWAIQGGNLYNWTGHVDTSKKYLIHWAAYNDMPEVLRQFYKQGANLSEKDANDFTPIDLAVINKSYNSFKLLAELGFRPKDELVKQAESKSIKKILDQTNQSQKKKKGKNLLKLLFVPLFCFLSWFLMAFTNQFSGIRIEYTPLILAASLWIALTFILKVEPEARYINSRYSGFHSDIIDREVNNKSNHFLYYLLNVSISLTGIITLIQCQTNSYLIALLYLVQLYITVVYIINTLVITYGVARNLTHEEMLDSHKCKYLWKRIHYIDERRMLIRKFNNPLDRGFKENVKRYLARNLT